MNIFSVRNTLHRTMITTVFVLATLVQLSQAEDPGRLVQEVMAKQSVRAGLFVHLGQVDGHLEAVLVNENGWLVHALSTDADAVHRARSYLTSRTHYGSASVEHVTQLIRLPYADNLVNVIVVDNPQECSVAEITRVLAPGGILLADVGNFAESRTAWKEQLRNTRLRIGEPLGKSPRWLSAIKQRPSKMDQWTHHRHAADGNRLSNDSLVAVPTGPRWITSPEFSDHSYRNMLVSDRLLLTVTRNRHEAVQYLTARNADNGLLQWERQIELPKLTPREIYSKQLPWPLVAHAGRVYAKLADMIAVLDSTTGKIVKQFDMGDTPLESIRELLVADEKLVFVGSDHLIVFDALGGERKWSLAAQAGDVVLGEGKLFYSEANLKTTLFDVVRIDLATGQQDWRREIKDIRAVYIDRRSNSVPDKLQMIHQPGYVIIAGSDRASQGSIIAALSSRDGRELGRYASKERRVDQIVFRDGLIWVPPSQGIDPKSGKVSKTLEGVRGGGVFVSSTCQAPVCTTRFVFAPRPSVRAFDFASSRTKYAPFALSTCGIGSIPANGLLYNSAQTGCLCSYGAVHGLAALEFAEPIDEKSPHVLEHGPAFGETIPIATKVSDREWPLFRGNVQRSGATTTRVSAGAQLLWRTPISTQRSPATKYAGIDADQAARQRITPPVIAEGRLLVAETDAHRVVALDAATGKQQWAFTAGGRIDSPPTVHQGLCLFGSHDGWVYCLRVDNGKLVWRLRAAPRDKRIVAFGQLESPWPVFGSVLVLNNMAFVTAGRSSSTQDGVIALAIAPRTGEVLWEQKVAVGLNDLLVSDGHSLYLRNLRLDPTTGKTFQAARLTGFKGPGEVRIPGNPERGPLRTHYLYSGWFSTLLDGSWRFAKTTYAKGNQRRTYDGHTFGQVIAFNERRTYAFQTGYWSGDHLYGGPRYPTQLVAADNVEPNNAPADSTPKPLWTVKPEPNGWIEAMTLMPDLLFVAGPVDRHKRHEKGGFLWAVSTESGKKLSQQTLPSAPCLEGLAAANSRLFVSTQDGEVRCYGEE